MAEKKEKKEKKHHAGLPRTFAESLHDVAELVRGGLLGDKKALASARKKLGAHHAIQQATLNPVGPTLKQAGKKKKKKKKMGARHPMDPRNLEDRDSDYESER